MYLEIRPDGTVSGSSTRTANSVLELRSVKPGQTVIRGLSSSLYLCLDGRGHLNGQSQYKEDDCTFQELLLADGYTRFLSARHGLLVSLASKPSQRQFLPFTLFLPLINGLARDGLPSQPSQSQGSFDADSEDPLGMRLNSIMSPLFSMNK
ncbi:fibroblast growth factor 21 [Lampris incognitus]|uniref:fibroblast growth factor 21 n=1 Tax=Lampris incognitus TaxID=2546036 RepID=UPI0024B5860B|nr:fibroblast growth factor 21 [Lampris incognitus]